MIGGGLMNDVIVIASCEDCWEWDWLIVDATTIIICGWWWLGD